MRDQPRCYVEAEKRQLRQQLSGRYAPGLDELTRKVLVEELTGCTCHGGRNDARIEALYELCAEKGMLHSLFWPTWDHIEWEIDMGLLMAVED